MICAIYLSSVQILIVRLGMLLYQIVMLINFVPQINQKCVVLRRLSAKMEIEREFHALI
jgi:Na+-translocating ferredoxin:NAD+ oxidoreductase RnfE subunit